MVTFREHAAYKAIHYRLCDVARCHVLAITVVEGRQLCGKHNLQLGSVLRLDAAGAIAIALDNAVDEAAPTAPEPEATNG